MKFLPTAAAAIVLASLAACNSGEGDKVRNVVDNQADALDNQADRLEEQADNLVGAAANKVDNMADAVENKADALRAAGEKAADDIEKKVR